MKRGTWRNKLTEKKDLDRSHTYRPCDLQVRLIILLVELYILKPFLITLPYLHEVESPWLADRMGDVEVEVSRL